MEGKVVGGSSQGPAVTDPPGSSEGLFVRNATGLVRSMSQRDNMILAALAGAPAAFVAITIFFVFAGLPGGNVYLGALLTIPLILAFAYAFGLMTAVIPRSGGDYTINSRVLTPSLGLLGSFCMVFGGALLSGAFLGRLFATLGVAPSLQTIGVVADSHTIFGWGEDVANGKGWWFALGVLMFAIAAAAHLGGIRWVRRALAIGFFGSTAGLLIATLIALFTSEHGFANAFNSTTSAFTGSPDNYNGIMATATEAGVDLSPGFSWATTIPVIGIFASSSIYTYFASFAGGELRQAASRRTGNRMALGGLLAITIDIICIIVLLNSWGREFLTAAFGGGFPAELGTVPAYFTLSSFQVGSTVFAVLMCLSFLLVFPMLAVEIGLCVTRSMFAYSFDGLLPSWITTVSKRTNAPVAAVGIAFVMFVAALAWGIFIADDLLQIIIYATIIQMIPMMLVGLSAAVLPWRRPELYRASGLTRTIGGVPLVSIAGVSAILAGAFIIWIYFHYEFFGLADTGKFAAWCGGIAGAGLIYYLAARAYRKWQGRDLSLVYAEIPPE
jgi:basic amino acid/polyamine antiporter, APA family